MIFAVMKENKNKTAYMMTMPARNSSGKVHEIYTRQPGGKEMKRQAHGTGFYFLFHRACFLHQQALLLQECLHYF